MYRSTRTYHTSPSDSAHVGARTHVSIVDVDAVLEAVHPVTVRVVDHPQHHLVQPGLQVPVLRRLTPARGHATETRGSISTST